MNTKSKVYVTGYNSLCHIILDGFVVRKHNLREARFWIGKCTKRRKVKIFKLVEVK